MSQIQQLPAYITQGDSNATSVARRALMNVGTGSPPYLSIEGGNFTLIDSGGNRMPLPNKWIDVCIVDVNDHVSKCWFGSNYDPRNPTPPVCWSDNGVGPSRMAPEPQWSNCGTCPKGKWGSKISQLGSEVKECPDHQKVVLVVPGMPQHKFLLRIPGGSFTNWRGYVAKFEGTGVDVPHVITRIQFDESQGLTGMLMFTGVGFLDDATATHMLKIKNGNEADMIIGRTDLPIAGLLAPPTHTVQQQTGFQQPLALNAGAQVAIPASPAFAGAGQPAFAITASPSDQPMQQQPQQPVRRGRRGRPPAAAGPVAGTQAPFVTAPAQPQGQPFGQPQQAPQQPGNFQQPQAFQPAQPQANGAAPQTTFGFAQANPPPNEMQGTINKLFG